MRLVPRSLFARLSLTLIGVLVVAQLVALGIHFADRGRVLYRAVGLPFAQRIATEVERLDALEGFARMRHLHALDSPRLRVALVDRPIEEEVKTSGWRALLFVSLLRRELGLQRPFTLAFDEGPPPGMGSRGTPLRHRSGMRRHFSRFGMAPEGGLWIHVEVALSDGQWVAFYRHVPREAFGTPYRLLLSLAILLIAVTGVSLLAVHWLTRPLGRLARAADSLGRDLDSEPLAESGPEEVRRALHAFNTMQQRLSRLVNDRARILAAISHDLKTPLTRLRLRTELLDDPALQAKFGNDLDEMEQLVETTLDFMRDAAGDEAPVATDIDALLGSLQSDYADSGHEIALADHSILPLTVRPRALRRCLANLIDNALKYAGSARIEIEDGTGAVTLRVVDNGPGLPDAQLEAVFEPFRRGEASRSRATGGTGLGLTIARSVARAHGGDLVLANRPDGGLEARLTLPR